MRIVNKKNKIIYKYLTHKISEGVITSILLLICSIILFIFSIILSYIFLGNAPTFVAGIAISAFIFDIGSLFNLLLEIYYFENFHIEVRNLLIIQIIFMIFYILVL